MTSNPSESISRRWRLAFIGAASLWVLTLLGAVYVVFDQAVTIDGMTIGNRDTREAAEILARLGPRMAPGASPADLVAILRQQHPDAFIVATDSTVAIGQLTFRFAARGLRQIDLIYDP